MTTRLAIHALAPETQFHEIETLLRAGDLAGARALARMVRSQFPLHCAHQRLEHALTGVTADAVLQSLGWSKPWNLVNVPKKAHFYWGSECTSFLRYLSIATFQLFNPDWEINLYVPKTLYRGGAGWTTPEVYEGSAYQGRDYARQLFSLPGIHIREVDFAEFPEIAQAPEIYKSDFFRWHILDQVGGLYSDTDIVFNRPIREAPCNSRENREIQVGICQHSDGHIIGFFLSAPGNPFFCRIQNEARTCFNAAKYQSLGSHLLNRLYPTAKAISTSHPGMRFVNLPMDLVYPLDHRMIEKIHQKSDAVRLPAGTIGLHWYGGSPLSQRYNNLIDHETCGHFGTLLDRLAASVVTLMQAPTAKTAAVGSRAAASPSFSVLVPTFNQENYLPLTLNSLLAQTRQDWEAVIVDDGSTDSTWAILQSYAARDPRIRAFRQPNGGVGAALNHALSEARAPWICWLSSDDLYEPDALETFAQGIMDYPAARFFYSNFFQLFEETGEKRPMLAHRQVHLPSFDLQTICLLEANYINGITVCIQKTIFDEVGAWKPELRYAQDHDLWLRISAHTRLRYLDRRIAVTRVHAAQGSRTFSMGGYFDSARGCLEFLNSRPFEDLFPWLDIKSPLAIGMAMKATCLIAISPQSFIYQGVGANTVLLERLDEWLQKYCPPDFALLPQNMREVFRKEPLLYKAHRDTIDRFGTPERKPFQPQDPLDLMELELARLMECGEHKAADQLRHYLVKVVGRRLPAALDPDAPQREAFLIEPDWTGSAWAHVLFSYLEAFTDSDPVRLIFLLDPARDDQITLEDATNRLMEIVHQTGLKKFPDLVLVNQMEELPVITENLSRLQRIGNDGTGLDALAGDMGVRLHRVHLQRVSHAQASSEPLAVNVE
jgi:glycosyltransferase involved in cell wall biosynthesis